MILGMSSRTLNKPAESNIPAATGLTMHKNFTTPSFANINSRDSIQSGRSDFDMESEINHSPRYKLRTSAT